MPRSTRSLLRVTAMVLVLTVAKCAGLIQVNDKSSSSDPSSTNAAPTGSSSTSSRPTSSSSNTGPIGLDVADGIDEVEAAFLAERSGVMLSLAGDVLKILPDDNDGSRHQKFIVELESGRTVLITHNIDLAKRVPLTEGDAVIIYGQYEWNDRGGLVHWTHKDPGGRHAEGYIEHAGTRYE